VTILERLLRHDAWTTRSLLLSSSELADSDLDRKFDIGHRSLRRTFIHIIGNMECWCDLMTAKPQRWSQRSTKPPATIPGLIERLDIVSEQLLALSKNVEDEDREEDFFIDTLDNPPTRKPLGGGLVHLATHSMHHRAQCLYIMRKLGMKPLIEGDALSWEQNHLGLKTWPDA
jgi:uncharacterized damage-inducible protein DinB